MDTKILKTFINAAVFLFIVGSVSAEIKDQGYFGNVYDIKERDALQEIESFMASMDNDGTKPIINKEITESKIKNYKPDGLISVPRATESRTRFIRPEHTLEMDIKDDKGNILYPKGYKFSPLDYVQNPRTYIAINANDPIQVEWFKKSEYSKKIDVTLLITEGSYYDLSKSVSNVVYYCLPEIHKGFQIEKVPSIIKQEGNQLKIVEQKID